MSAVENLRRVWPLLRPRVSRLLLAVALGVASLGSALALAGLSAWLITRAWQMPPVLDLSIVVVSVRALGISRAVLGYCQRLASHDTALHAAGSLRQRLYDRLACGPVDSAMRLRSGQLVTRLGSDVDELSDLLVRAVLPIAVAGVLGVAAVAVVAVMSPATAVLLAACLAAAGIAAPWLAGRAVVSSERAAAAHRQARDVAVMTALDHADRLRVGGRLPDVVAEVAARQTEWGRVEDVAARPAALAAATQTLAIGVVVVGAAVAAIGMSTAAAPTTMAVLMLLPLSAFEATASLPAAAVTLIRARLAAQRLTELVSEPGEPATRDGGQPSAPTGSRLETRCLTTGYAHSTEAGPIDVVLPTGARLAVVGPSGAGKSAFLMTLAGLLEPRDGVVTIGGASVAALSEDELRSRVTYFAEDAHVFGTTVGDNLRVARGGATDDDLVKALERVGLEEWTSALPDGLATILVGGAEALSAGQRRRLLLARALLSVAPIVLLDEPTENLDADDADAFLRALLAEDGGLFDASRTVVVATHHLPDDVGCPRLDIGSHCRKNIRLSTFGPSAARVGLPV